MFSWKPAVVAVTTLIALAALPFAAPGAFAASGTIRIDAGQQPVAVGSEFDVKILQNADVTTTGASTSLTFDASIMQIVEVAPGPDYADATFLLGVSVDTDGDGTADTSQSPTQAIDEANSTGQLKNITMFILPGSGTVVGTGERVVATVTMQAVANGSSSLSLAPGCVSTPDQSCQAGGSIDVSRVFSEMTDADGNAFAPDTSAGGATVTVSGNAPPPGTAPAGTSPAAGTAVATNTAAPATTTVAGSPTAFSTVAGSSARPDVGSTILAVSPATQTVAQATEFKFEVKQTVTVATKGAEAEVKFKSDLLQIVKVEPGSAWTKATGASASALQTAIDAANKDGVFKTSFLFTGSDTVKAGDTTVMTITMKGKDGKDGKSAIELANVALTDASGATLPATSQNGEVIVGSGDGGGSSLLLPIVGGAVVVAALGAGGAAYYMRRRRAWA